MTKVRQFWLLLHRYLGLAMTGFLVLVALTGSVLAFRAELDCWLNPDLLTVPPRTSRSLDPFKLRERAEALDPRIRVDTVNLWREPDAAYSAWAYARPDPATGKPYDVPLTQVFLDPYTGERLGSRPWGEISLERRKIISFLYRLHFSLALPSATGNLGGYVLGAVALGWTIDCFVGFYLTLPRRRRTGTSIAATSVPGTRRSWCQRWKPAWRLKPAGHPFRAPFDLHRAPGLWLWPMLFVLAWSSVAFNLPEVYQPVMNSAFGLHGMEDLPKLSVPLEHPHIDWRAAYALGQSRMREELERNGIAILREDSLALDRDRGLYVYTVRSTADVGRRTASSVTFDANTGAVKSFDWPGSKTETLGNAIPRWLIWLHTAAVLGLPMQVFVCAMGLAIVAVAITGVIIWLHKRRARGIAVSQRQSSPL
jgi:uncharacterized iron-regulated membrane protein